MNRTPPYKVIQRLRSEVGFGCPICGSPFLTWHHFDPPWHDKEHHNPRGMIALCPEHHGHADGGHWTKDELHALKRPASLDKRVSAMWPWRPEKAVFMLGNSYYVGKRPLLALGGRSVFEASKYSLSDYENPAVMFSANLQDESGRSILTLLNNTLSFNASDFSDIHCPPQAKTFEATGRLGISLKLQHKRLSLDEFLEQVPTNTFNAYDTVDSVSRLIKESAIDSEGKIPLIEISGHMKTNDIEILLSREELTFQVKSYNNETAHMPGRFYSPLLSSGALRIAQGRNELIRFG